MSSFNLIPDYLNLIKAINESPYKAFFAIAGGGQSFIGDYCKISGASNTMIGALVPYNQFIFEQFVGCKIEKFASPESARKLAQASFKKCIEAGVEKQFAIGIGASSSIVKDGERKGREHRVNVASYTYNRNHCESFILDEDRITEDRLASMVIFRTLVYAALDKWLVFSVSSFPLVKSGVTTTINASEIELQLFNGTINCIPHIPYFIPSRAGGLLGVYPGSWNPLHDAHRKVIQTAQDILGKEVVLELSINNTDKGQLDFIDLEYRRTQMNPYNYILTNANTFFSKIDVIKTAFPKNDIVFIVGADTWNRIWDEKYGLTIAELKNKFTTSSIKFLVFGRKGHTINSIGNEFRIKSKLAESFSSPISSSAIRNL